MNPDMVLAHNDLEKFLAKSKSWSNICWSYKLDGVRVWAYIDKDGTVKYLSRNGKYFPNFSIFDEIVKQIITGIKVQSLIDITQDPVILDCEVTSKDGKFNRLLTQVQRMKELDPKIFQLNLIDIPDKVKPFKDRYKLLTKTAIVLKQEMKKNSVTVLKQNSIKEKELQSVAGLTALRDKIISMGEEGIILRTWDGLYEYGKRSRLLVKMKKKDSMDLKVIGMVEGKGKFKGKLGKLICTFNGKSVGVGSGAYTVQDREEFFKNPPEVIEVEYMEITPGGSLRDPRFLRVRDDK